MARPEKSKTALGQRLRELRGDTEREAWAQSLGVSKTTIANYERGDRVPDAEFLQRLADRSINMQWLLTGETTYGGKRLYASRTVQMRAPRSDVGADAEMADFAFVSRYSVQASAGTGLAVLEEREADRLAFRSDWLRSIGINPQYCGLITVAGDSQEPTVPNGALALVDMTPGQPLRSGCFYVVLVDQDLLIKRLNRRIDGTVELISDNPAYPTEVIDPKDLDRLNIPGRVVWIGRSL